VRLIVELEDATDTDRLQAILDDLAQHRPYVRSAVLEVDD
jgi:hypothetical protein